MCYSNGFRPIQWCALWAWLFGLSVCSQQLASVHCGSAKGPEQEEEEDEDEESQATTCLLVGRR